MVHMGQTKMVRQRSGGFFRINRKDRVSRVISIHYLSTWSSGTSYLETDIRCICIIIQILFRRYCWSLYYSAKFANVNLRFKWLSIAAVASDPGLVE